MNAFHFRVLSKIKSVLWPKYYQHVRRYTPFKCPNNNKNVKWLTHLTKGMKNSFEYDWKFEYNVLYSTMVVSIENHFTIGQIVVDNHLEDISTNENTCILFAEIRDRSRKILIINSILFVNQQKFAASLKKQFFPSNTWMIKYIAATLIISISN